MKLTDMPNIAEKLEAQLNQAGIFTPEELGAIGSRQAWLRIKAIDPSACLMRLCALEGALQNIRWHYLPDDTKKDLKAFYLAHKGEG